MAHRLKPLIQFSRLFTLLSVFVCAAFAVRPLTAVAASPLKPTTAKPFSMISKACREWQSLTIDYRKTENGMQTDQVAVIRGSGEILFSWADAPYKKSSPHQLWSASKTVSSMLLATAIVDGKVKLTDRMTQFLPAAQRRNPSSLSAFSAITIEHLLEMTSGFKWSEHSTDGVEEASVLPLMYSEGYKNFTRYIFDVDMVAHPGQVWNYSSINADLMMAVLKKVYRNSYDEFPWKNLFNPLAMKSARFEQDSAGVYLGAAYVYLSAEDMTKLGMLMLKDGVVNGRRLLPEGWVARSNEPVKLSLAKIRTRADLQDFGVLSKGGWWLNRPVPGVGKPYPRSPDSLLFADGYLGQWIAVLPEQGLVLARTGHERESAKHIDKFIAGAVACFAK
jgi:CubicO group peptidase (beta-lactamase class C family)